MPLRIELQIGVAIQRLRLARGLSQRELAERCDFVRTYIGNVERAETSITIRNLSRIAKGLGLSASAVLAEAEGVLPHQLEGLAPTEVPVATRRCGRCNALLAINSDGAGGLIARCPRHGTQW